MGKGWKTGTAGSAMMHALSVAIIFFNLNQAETLLIDVRHFVRHSNSFRLFTNGDVPVDNKIRKRRKNKYENFSRVEMDYDPLDTLIEESNRMNQEIFAKIHSAKRKSKTYDDVSVETIPSVPNKVFPDVKTIDPYDPETFGYLLIGTITGAHGVHGWLKVQSSTDFPLDRLCSAGIRHLKAASKRAPREVLLLNGKHRLGDEYLIQLDQINDRDTAQKLRGSLLYIREEQKSYDLKVDEYVVSDLVGLDVYLKVDQDDAAACDRYVGTVAGVVFSDDVCSVPGLGHDYLEITLPRGVGGTSSYRDEMVLIPMVPAIVPEVDITGRRVVIDPPTGLLDLTYVRDEKTRIKGFLPPARS